MPEIYCGQATKYLVNLSDEERIRLEALVAKGTTQARVVTRALILLAADREATDASIDATLHCSTDRVAAVRKRCVEGGLDRALYADAPDPRRPRACLDERPVQLVSEIRTPASGGPPASPPASITSTNGRARATSSCSSSPRRASAR